MASMIHPLTGRKQTQEHIEKRTKKLRGKPLSAEHRAKLSLSHKGRITWMKGKKHKEESKIKMLGNKNSLGYCHTEEARKRMSEKMKGRKPHPNTIKRVKEARLYTIIPTKDTLPERLIQNALRSEGLEFETHKAIFGQPDIFIKPNICIFVDGDYWHNLPKMKARDVIVNNTLESQGFEIMRFWEHEIKNNLKNCIDQISIMVNG